MHTHLASMRSLKLSRCFIGAVAVMCLGAASASAQSIARFGHLTKTGSWPLRTAETVSFKEPSTLVPVVVTWNADYTPPADTSYIGLDVNGLGCQKGAYGSEILPDNPGPVSGVSNGTYQFVVLVSDSVLTSGSNSFELCIGGAKNTDTIALGEQTLTVSKF